MLHEIDLSRVDLNLLVLFEVVREERHVGRAAQRLNLSPSAVSHGIRRLRRLLDDPVFLKTPKGVVLSARAAELADPIAETLQRLRGILASTVPFDPATSRRRFTLGAPDGVSAVMLSALLATRRSEAPGLDIAVRQVLPIEAETDPGRSWRGALEELETRALDVAIVPTEQVPPRFGSHRLAEEDFVVVVRAGHPFARRLDIDRYCGMEHLVVSATGDPFGFVDQALADLGRARRVALTVPNFMYGLAVVAETDLACAVPRRFANVFGMRFGLVSLEPPLTLPRFPLNAVVLAPALADTGIAWLLGKIAAQFPGEPH